MSIELLFQMLINWTIKLFIIIIIEIHIMKT